MFGNFISVLSEVVFNISCERQSDTQCFRAMIIEIEDRLNRYKYDLL